MQDANCSDDTGKTGKVGNASSDDKRDRPVYRDEANPDKLSSFSGESGCAEQLDKDAVVQNCGVLDLNGFKRFRVLYL